MKGVVIQQLRFFLFLVAGLLSIALLFALPQVTNAQITYGVHVDESAGSAFGWAWSDGVGWINFTGVSYNNVSGALTGTARIISFDTAGQDGALELSGDCVPSCGGYGVFAPPGGGTVTGSAWNDLIGWVEFAPASFGGVNHEPADLPSLTGWAWNDNIGWISLSEGTITPFSGSGLCAASPFNTCSFAWSDTMGWISHNSVDDPATPNFGVHVPPAGGALDGHAWNDTLGYIDFSGGSFDQATNEISGTASILDLGANGTVTLRGDCTPSCGGYGLSIVGDQVTGFAWNDTIGWIDFQPALGGVNFFDDQEPSLSGWAWNDSYGWIAVRFTAYELEWGVNLESNGNLTGFAWNDNMGWLNYDHPGPFPAAPTNSAQWDENTGEVSGWVYADGINAGGGDPWILLRDNGAIPYGVSIDFLTGVWSGWAWSDAFGWIDYDHAFGSVVTEVIATGPETPILETPLNCTDTYTINPTAGLTPALDWNDYAALDGSSQLNYHIQVDTDPLFSAPFIDEVVSSTSSVYTVGLGQLSYNVTYYWRVRVESSNNQWSEWGEVGEFGESNCFITPQHAPPDCGFTMTPNPAIADQEVQFTDTTVFYGGSTGSFWDWNFGDGNTQFGSDPIENQNPDHTYADPGDVTVVQIVRDSSGYECTTTSDEQVVQQLPEFRRVIPR